MNPRLYDRLYNTTPHQNQGLQQIHNIREHQDIAQFVVQLVDQQLLDKSK